MIGFKTTLLKFDKQGEKTGWTYILIPNKIAEKIKPGNKKSFRIKGKIDEFKIKSVALLPMGGGDFIMPVNATMRKAIKKNNGASVTVEMEIDKAPLKLSPGLMACLEDDPDSKSYFDKLAPSHQQYYSKWIESAKTDATKTKRIALCITAFANKLSYPEMMRLQKKDF
ncbi:MAG: YdeI/OmpD-associated family protein [Ferruginibacter sp.]